MVSLYVTVERYQPIRGAPRRDQHGLVVPRQVQYAPLSQKKGGVFLSQKRGGTVRSYNTRAVAPHDTRP
jgi:hypothetical protein